MLKVLLTVKFQICIDGEVLHRIEMIRHTAVMVYFFGFAYRLHLAGAVMKEVMGEEMTTIVAIVIQRIKDHMERKGAADTVKIGGPQASEIAQGKIIPTENPNNWTLKCLLPQVFHGTCPLPVAPSGAELAEAQGACQD